MLVLFYYLFDGLLLPFSLVSFWSLEDDLDVWEDFTCMLVLFYYLFVGLHLPFSFVSFCHIFVELKECCFILCHFSQPFSFECFCHIFVELQEFWSLEDDSDVWEDFKCMFVLFHSLSDNLFLQILYILKN